MGEHIKPFPADYEKFNTCINVQDYDADWRGFYRRAAEQGAAMRQRFDHEVNVLYGSNPYQIANLYWPHEAEGAPVLLFMHGGRFREGHPDYYDFLGEPWMERGVLYVSLGYRLEPDYPYPASLEDARLALEWAYKHVARYGGDPGRMVVAGHSAGATLAAMAAITSGWQQERGLPIDVVKGAVLLSGVYDFRGIFRQLVHGSPERVSPVRNIAQTPGHTLIAAGLEERNRRGEDLGTFARQSAAFAEAMQEAGGAIEVDLLENADHIGTALALGDPDSPIFPSVARILGLPEATRSDESLERRV